MVKVSEFVLHIWSSFCRSCSRLGEKYPRVEILFLLGGLERAFLCTQGRHRLASYTDGNNTVISASITNSPADSATKFRRVAVAFVIMRRKFRANFHPRAHSPLLFPPVSFLLTGLVSSALPAADTNFPEV